MQVITQKIVSIDHAELGEIINSYLREKDILPEGQKIASVFISGAMDVGLKTRSQEGVPLEDPIRIVVKWHINHAE